MSLLKKINRMPPAACRLLARTPSGRRLLSHSELSAISGLPRTTISEMSMLVTWKHVDAYAIDRFTIACGVNILRPSDAIKLLKRRKLIHLITAKGNQKLMIQRIFAALRSKQL